MPRSNNYSPKEMDSFIKSTLFGLSSGAIIGFIPSFLSGNNVFLPVTIGSSIGGVLGIGLHLFFSRREHSSEEQSERNYMEI